MIISKSGRCMCPACRRSRCSAWEKAGHPSGNDTRLTAFISDLGRMGDEDMFAICLISS